jgi:hypothetical protein
MRNSIHFLNKSIRKIHFQFHAELKAIVDDQTLPYDLEPYVRKLDDSRKRVHGVNHRLQVSIYILCIFK